MNGMIPSEEHYYDPTKEDVWDFRSLTITTVACMLTIDCSTDLLYKSLERIISKYSDGGLVIYV